MALLARLAELAGQGSQISIATTPPSCWACRARGVVEIDDDTTATTDYDQALPVRLRLPRDFLAGPNK
ncbi:hypothetical protein [Saccharopolyspora aridisoli]|uniref:hypothetical protein n=1 Tax=Saccharopolyspora aridisoli TaxID=2530385 RepID=UPI001F483C88|nr:hypothetical protein [Saccharopolyspora aridisoli]